MTLKRLLLSAAAAGMFAPQALAVHNAECIDCPTPPPCSAEGGCYPNRRTFGYYKTSWNRWPGDYDEPASSPAERTILDPTIIPKATEEDRAAPPPSEPKDDGPAASGPGEGARELDLPTLPPIPGAQPAPGNQQPPAADGPPGLPPLPGFGPPPGIGAPPSTGVQPQGRPKRDAHDMPPALPAGFATLLGERATVSRAELQVEASPSDAPPAFPAVAPAYYQPTRR